jgi:hypothetical protein
MYNNYEQFAAHMEERFPEIFKGQKYGGFAVGEGWWPMLESLCEIIQSHIKHHKDCPPIKIEQIKEKFGGLRFYYQGGDEFIHGSVWMAESMSHKLCEECGSPGERRNGGWIRTLCSTHEQERNQRLEDQARKDGLEL